MARRINPSKPPSANSSGTHDRRLRPATNPKGYVGIRGFRGNTRSVVRKELTIKAHLILAPKPRYKGQCFIGALASRFRRLPGRQIVSTDTTNTNAGKRRPSLRRSMVAHCFAVIRGSRSAILATFIPNRIFEVAPAMAAIAASVQGWAPSIPVDQSARSSQYRHPRNSEPNRNIVDPSQKESSQSNTNLTAIHLSYAAFIRPASLNGLTRFLDSGLCCSVSFRFT